MSSRAHREQASRSQLGRGLTSNSRPDGSVTRATAKARAFGWFTFGTSQAKRFVGSLIRMPPQRDLERSRARQAAATPTSRDMLYKTIVAAFVVSSGDALRIEGLNTRRAAVASAASALSLVPLAAFAELKQAGDADIYKRADEGKLNAARVRTLLSTQASGQW